MFVFKINGDTAVNKNSESRYLLVERTPMTIPSGGQDTVSWTGTLDPGLYLLVPSTTGCALRKRKSQPSPEVELVTVTSPSPTQGDPDAKIVALSGKFKDVLTEIFRQIDLDDSGGLNRCANKIYY